MYTGVPHLRGFHYRRSHYRDFWLMYVQVGDFHVSRGPPTVLLSQVLHNVAHFFASPKIRVRGELSVAKKIALELCGFRNITQMLVVML